MKVLINGVIYDSGKVPIGVKLSAPELKTFITKARREGELVIKAFPSGCKPNQDMDQFVTLDKHRADVIGIFSSKRTTKKRLQEMSDEKDK